MESQAKLPAHTAHWSQSPSDFPFLAGQGTNSPTKVSVQRPIWLTEQLFMPKSSNWWSQKRNSREKWGQHQAKREKQVSYSRNKLKLSSLWNGHKVRALHQTYSIRYMEGSRKRKNSGLDEPLLGAGDTASWPGSTVDSCVFWHKLITLPPV